MVICVCIIINCIYKDGINPNMLSLFVLIYSKLLKLKTAHVDNNPGFNVKIVIIDTKCKDIATRVLLS